MTGRRAKVKLLRRIRRAIAWAVLAPIFGVMLFGMVVVVRDLLRASGAPWWYVLVFVGVVAAFFWAMAELSHE